MSKVVSELLASDLDSSFSLVLLLTHSSDKGDLSKDFLLSDCWLFFQHLKQKYKIFIVRLSYLTAFSKKPSKTVHAMGASTVKISL